MLIQVTKPKAHDPTLKGTESLSNQLPLSCVRQVSSLFQEIAEMDLQTQFLMVEFVDMLVTHSISKEISSVLLTGVFAILRKWGPLEFDFVKNSLDLAGVEMWNTIRSQYEREFTYAQV